MKLPLFLFLTLPLLAQKVPLVGDAERVVQVLDASAFTADAKTPADARVRLQSLADGLRRWSGVQFGDRDDVTALGDRHLVVLGTPTQAAAAEALLRRIAGTATQQLLIATTICTVSKPTYERVFAELVAPAGELSTQQIGIVTGQGLLDGLRKLEGIDLLVCPQVITFPLQQATIASGEEVVYTKDFAIRQIDGKAVAAPIQDKVWDGIEVTADCMLLDTNKVLLRLGLSQRKVERPLATFRTTLTGIAEPVEIQMPKVDGVQGQATAVLPVNGTLVMAAQKADGSWVVNLTTVSLVQ